jgi:hypothetical protein
MKSATRTARLLAPWLVFALVIAGCSSEEPGTESPAAPAAEQPEPAEPQIEPLTGLEAPVGESVDRDHAVLVVKMDNTYSSSPQAGLSQADLVVEELVEGGLTRLAAFYYSQTPTVVGPVRSMRASDIGIVSPADASVVTSGAAAVTIRRIQDAEIRFYGEGSRGVYRETSRAAPYNVFTNLATIAKQAKNPDGRPADYLPWGTEADFLGVRRARSFDVSFGSGRTSQWRFDSGGYVNVNSYAAPDDQFPADSVLVLRVEVGDAGYRDPAGNPVPETRLEGSGPAMLFHAGRMTRAQWQKDTLDGTLSLSTPDGPLLVPAGRVWIELVPQATGRVTFR